MAGLGDLCDEYSNYIHVAMKFLVNDHCCGIILYKRHTVGGQLIDSEN